MVAGLDSRREEGTTPQLTSEAKAAIQAYLVKFAFPTGALIAIVSGLCGYVLSGIARIDASTEAAKAALFAAQSAAKAEASATRVSELANKASDEANSTLERSKRVATSTEETLKALLTSRDQVSAIIAGQYDEFAKKLYDIKSFREALTAIPQSEMSEFRERLSKIESTIYALPGPAVAATSAGVCPTGTFAVGVGSVSVPGGRAGFVESVSVLCRALYFQKSK